MPKKKNNNGTRLSPPTTGVTVRMYDTGFGDCFLLAFRAVDDEARYVLIDCGGFDHARVERVAQDVAHATGNRLHIVAITHEHTDHLNGFAYLETAFKDMKIDDLWLAWTEDEKNPVTKALKCLYRDRIKTLQAAIANPAIANLKKAGSPSVSRLENILAFDLVSNAASALKGNNIMAAVRSRSEKKLERPEDYLTPGERPLEIPGVKGVKCYVLGPPKDITCIKKLVDKDETYFKLAEADKEGAMMDKEDAFMAAVVTAPETGTAEEKRSFESSTPFDKTLTIEKQRLTREKKFAASHKFFSVHYGFGDEKKCGPKWRRIDSDWLEAAGPLALKINKMTNNTSLVLAFQLTETTPRKVLLFAADAQVGNLRSWSRPHWRGASDENVSGEDLIRQTVFYKVGHHGSSNATLREKGLEMMESPELVAMISVDENLAQARGWHHPDKKLVKRLKEKTRGRVIRSDKIPLNGSISTPQESTESEWDGRLKNLQWDKSQERLWIQFTVQ